MQVHDSAALEDLLESSRRQKEPLAGVAGAVPTKRHGSPSPKPLPPRARARAALSGSDKPGRRVGTRSVSTTSSLGPRPRTAPARNHGADAATHVGDSAEPRGTALGHTQNLGLKRTIFWPTKVIAVDRAEPVVYRSTVGREGRRVGFWEAGQSGPPGGYRAAPLPAGRRSRTANEVYGYSHRLTVAEQRKQRNAERERARSCARTAIIERFPTEALSTPQPEPQPDPKRWSVQNGQLIYVNTQEAGMQVHYSAHPASPVHVKVSQFSPTNLEQQQEQLETVHTVVSEDGKSQEESACSGQTDVLRSTGTAPSRTVTGSDG